MGRFFRQPNSSMGCCMKGSIYTSERCPICGGLLKHDENRAGLFCLEHPQVRAERNFRVRFRVSSKNLIQKSFRSYQEAIRFLTGLRFKHDEGSLDARDYQGDNPLSFENQAVAWLQTKKGRLSRNGYREIRRYIYKAVDSWGQRNVKTIGFGDVEDFLLGLQVSTKTQSNARSALHDFFVWLSRREGIPVPDMPEINFELGWRRIVDIETQQAILGEVKRQSWDINPKIWIGIRWLCTYVSIRPNELRNLHEREIAVNGFFVIPSPKEKKPKLVPMLDEDIELYRSLPVGLPDLYFFRHILGNGAAKPGQQFAKDYFYRWWKRACSALGVDGVDLYGGTRHSSTSALSAYFSEEELRNHGTMHGTNSAFRRYMQTEGQPSLKVYAKMRDVAEGGNKPKTKVIPLDRSVSKKRQD